MTKKSEKSAVLQPAFPPLQLPVPDPPPAPGMSGPDALSVVEEVSSPGPGMTAGYCSKDVTLLLAQAGLPGHPVV